MIGRDSSASEVIARIASVYDDLNLGLGWKYIYGPLSSRQNPKLVTIGLNPGGGKSDRRWRDDAHLAALATGPDWNEYFHQPWSDNGKFTPLQVQIQTMTRQFFPKCTPGEILSFQLVPFRSPSWDDFALSSRKPAIDLGIELLDWTLAHLPQSTPVIGFGLGAAKTKLKRWFEVIDAVDIPTGWGRVRAELCSTPKAASLVLLPHLSRYRIFGRPEFVGSRLFQS